MGLDMYLTAERYISTYNEDDKELAEQLGKVPVNSKFGRIKSITTDFMYWRKANAIHKWFVDKKQNGVDECQKTQLNISDLLELLDVCKKVYDDHSLAPELLPTESGFFFGSTEYDEYFFEDVKYTIDRLGKLLTIPEEELKGWDFYYQSSW